MTFIVHDPPPEPVYLLRLCEKKMYFNVQYAGSGASSPSPTPPSMKSAVIHVAGLSGSRPSSYEGPGKSCLCYRFVYPSEADFISEHPSVLSLNDFQGEVLLGEHSVYWGTRTLSLQQKKGKAKEEQVTVEVIEHTEFLQDITNAPFRVDSKQSYAERALKGRIKGGKQSFKARDFLGFPSEYSSVVAPANINQQPRGLLLVVDCSRGGNCLHEYFQKQLHLLEETLSLKKKDKACRAVEVAIVATKCDELDDDRIGDVEKLAKKYKVPLYQCSAKENVSVVECFATLAAQVLKMTVVHATLEKASSIEKGMSSTLQAITMKRTGLKSYFVKRITRHDITYAELERAEELIEAKSVLGAVEPFNTFLQHMITLKVQALAGSDSLTVDAVREYVAGHPDMHSNKEKCLGIATQLMETTGNASPSMPSPTVSSIVLPPCYDSGFDTDSVSTHTPYSLSAHTSFSLPPHTSYLPAAVDPNEADQSSSDDGEPGEADSNLPPAAFPASTFKPSSPHLKAPHCHPRRNLPSQVAQKMKGGPPVITPKPSDSLPRDTTLPAKPGNGCDADVAPPSLASTFLGDKPVTPPLTSGDILSVQFTGTQAIPPIPAPLPKNGRAAKAVELPSIPIQGGVSLATPAPNHMEVHKDVAPWEEDCAAVEDVYDAPFAPLPNDPPQSPQPVTMAADVQDKMKMSTTLPPPVMTKAHVYDETNRPTAAPPPAMKKAHVYDEMTASTAPPPVMTKAHVPDKTKMSAAPPPPAMKKTHVYDEMTTSTAPPPVMTKAHVPDKTRMSATPPPAMKKAHVYDEMTTSTAPPPVMTKAHVPDKTRMSAAPPPTMKKAHVYDEMTTSSAPPPVMTKAHVPDKTKMSTAPPPPVKTKAHMYDEMTTSTAPPPVTTKAHVYGKKQTSTAPSPVMTKAHVYDEMNTSAIPPQPVVPTTPAVKDVVAHAEPTVARDTLQQPSSPPIPLPKPPTGGHSRSPEPPPKPARKSTKTAISASPSSSTASENSKLTSAVPSAKKGSRIAQLQQQLQVSGSDSDSPSVPAVHGKGKPKSPLPTVPGLPLGPCQPLLPPQNNQEHSSYDSDDPPVPIPPRNYLDEDVGEALPTVPPRQYLSDADFDEEDDDDVLDDDDDGVDPIVPPRNYDDGSLVEPECPVVPDRGYSREDVYGRSPALTTPSTTEKEVDTTDLPPEIPDRNYSMSEVLGPSSMDELADEQHPPLTPPTEVDIDLRPPMPLPNEANVDPPLEAPPPLDKCSLLPPGPSIPNKSNTMPERCTPSLEGRPLPALPFVVDKQFDDRTSSHQYCDPDHVIPEAVRQTTPPRTTTSYLQPTNTLPQPLVLPSRPPNLRSYSEDSCSPPVPQKQARKVLNSSRSIDAPPSLPPKVSRRPPPAVPPNKPIESLPDPLTPRSRAVTARELPLPAIPGLSLFKSSTTSTGGGGHSYDYVENWLWQLQTSHATPPRGSQQLPASNPLFPSVEEILSRKLVRPPFAAAPEPYRYPATRKPPVPIPLEDDDYEEMETQCDELRVSVERQIVQQLPATTVSQLSYSHYCNTAPVQSKRDSVGYVPVDEPFRNRANTEDSLGYIPMDCPPELALFIRQKLMRDQVQYGNWPHEPAQQPPKKVVAMDLESVEYYNVQRSRGGRQHMLDYLDVQPLPPNEYGNLPPPRPPKQNYAPPRPPKQTNAPPRPPKQSSAPPRPPKSSTLPTRSVKRPPPAQAPKPIDRPRAAGPGTPPLVPLSKPIDRPRAAGPGTPPLVPVPPRNILRQNGPFVFNI